MLGETVALVGRFRRLEFRTLGEGFEQGGEGDGGVQAGQAGSGLERHACVGLGVGEVAGAQVMQGAVAREPEHVRQGTKPAGVASASPNRGRACS